VNGQTTGFLYDGAQAIAELRGSAIDTVYHTGLAIDEVLARYAPSGNRTLLTDALMSVIAQANDDRTVGNYYAYSPYGEALTLGPDEGNSIQYTGRENDGTGLYYYRARYYDPVLKRFISEDPIGLSGGLNTYLYADADPVSKSDPLGLDAYMCKKPLHALGGSGSRSGPDIFGNPFYHQYVCVKIGNTTVCGGQDREGGPWSPGTPSKDTFNPDTCEKKDDRACMDNCLMQSIGDPYRPPYGLFGPGTNCQEWADDAYSRCKKQCKGKL
jgi:RHS repeat-associated protein